MKCLHFHVVLPEKNVSRPAVVVNLDLSTTKLWMLSIEICCLNCSVQLKETRRRRWHHDHDNKITVKQRRNNIMKQRQNCSLMILTASIIRIGVSNRQDLKKSKSAIIQSLIKVDQTENQPIFAVCQFLLCILLRIKAWCWRCDDMGFFAA